MKTTPVFVTNKTPLQIAIEGHEIYPRAINQELAVYNVDYFINAVKAAYPNGEIEVNAEPKKAKKEPPADALTALSELGLSDEILGLLASNEIDTTETLISKTSEEVLAIKGIGKKSLEEIAQALDAENLKLKEVDNDN